MSKVCKHHAKHPVKIYSQCIGCELEMLHSENERLKAENVRLVAAADAAEQVLGSMPMNDARLWGVYTKLVDTLKEYGIGGERDESRT